MLVVDAAEEEGEVEEEGVGPLAFLKEMKREQWAKATAGLGDDDLRDSVHASMRLCEASVCVPRCGDSRIDTHDRGGLYHH